MSCSAFHAVKRPSSKDITQDILTSIKGNDIVTNKQKITGDNSNLDLVNMNAHIKFGEFLSICSHDNKQKRNFGSIKDLNSGTNLRKMTCNNSKLDLVNMKAHIKFCENRSVLKILSGKEISAQIKGRNSGTNVQK